MNPVPAFVIVKAVITPLEIVGVIIAPLPPPPLTFICVLASTKLVPPTNEAVLVIPLVIITFGILVYPEPELVTVMALIPPDETVATAVALLPAPPVISTCVLAAV